MSKEAERKIERLRDELQQCIWYEERKREQADEADRALFRAQQQLHDATQERRAKEDTLAIAEMELRNGWSR